MPSGIDDETLTDEVIDYLGQVRTSSFTPQFNYTTQYPEWPDSLRFNSSENGGTIANGELSASASGDNPKLETRAVSNYAPGSPSVFGTGSRITDAPTGDQFIEWGAGDGTDDVGFGRDSTGAYIYYQNDGGGKTKVYENDEGNGGWNGEGVRGFNQFEKSRICWVDHLWYKGGPVSWRILDYYDAPESSKMKTIHTETPPVFSNPNLPMCAEVDAGTTTSDCTLELNALHYIKSEEQAKTRINGEFVELTGIDDTQWYHLISWKKRDNWNPLTVRPNANNILAFSGDMKMQALLNPSLSVNTARSIPSSTSSPETGVKVTTDASLDNAASPTERRWVSAVVGGGAQTTADASKTDLSFDLAGDQVMAIAVKAYPGQSGITARGSVSWEEAF